MGYLSLKQPITVTFNDGTRRSFLPGVNKDVTAEQAEHWYVKAAGGEYFDKIEDAHKNAPEMKNTAAARRSEYEQAVKAAVLAKITAETLRKDLVALEKEMGIDTKKADEEFRKTMKDEEKRLEELYKDAVDADEVQKAQDEAGALSPAEAERKAAGSAEVANTEMDGPAKEEATKTAAETNAAIQSQAKVGETADPKSDPAKASAMTPSTKEENIAAGSKEVANTATDKAKDGKSADTDKRVVEPNKK